MDLSSLVTWAHAHGTICSHIPALEILQNKGHPSKDSSVLWICGVGHAYHWQYGKLYLRNREEKKGLEKKRFMTSDASLRETGSDGKRFRMTPSFERTKADAVSTASSWRSPEVPQQKGNMMYRTRTEPSPRVNAENSKSMRSCFAAEQHFSVSGGEGKPDRPKMKLESSEEPQIISDEEQSISVEDNHGDRINQSVLSESPVKDVAAEADLHMHRSQKMAFNKPTPIQTSGFAPPGKSPSTLARIMKPPLSSQESLESGFLQVSPLNPAGSITKNSRARNSSASATPKEHLKSAPVSNSEAKVQHESPASVTFFELEATVDVQQQLQLSPPEHSMAGTGFSGNIIKTRVEGSKPSGSRHTHSLSAFLSPESSSAEHPSQPSDESKTGSRHTHSLSAFLSPKSSSAEHPSQPSDENELEKKRKRNRGDIKAFKDWLVLHCPSEMREIHNLPPEDLDNYLASFYSSAKRRNGTEFSASSLRFCQSNIERYLRDHGYKYSVAKGPEFRASQEALKLKQQHLSQKEREEEWSILENLTDEDMERLHKKGIFSKIHPQGFLHLLFTNTIRGFGASTHSGSPNLYWGQLVLKEEGELEFLEWRQDPGAGEGLPRPRIFARPQSPESCLVAHYKEYAKRRPLDMLHDYDPLYLAPKLLCSLWDQTWYSRKALTKAKMEKIMKVIIQQVKEPMKKPKE